MVTVITGGIKSGKTSFGLKFGGRFKNKVYIATAEGFDNEMKKKIEQHRLERGEEWITIEEALELHNAITLAKEFDLIIIDCITLWINNLLYYKKDLTDYLEKLLYTISEIKNNNLIIITNEVGLGVIPYDKITREYVNFLGIANQKIASIADNLILMVSGNPLIIKGDIHYEL
jgi:adenosylcobinamide kinase/adenosylcobinamide-phosphate guanylyltransferase